MDKVAFYGGVLVVVIGLLVWIIRPNQAVGKSEIALFGMKFVFDTPAFAVMIIGIALMLLSPRLPPYLVSATPEPIKKVVCIGQNENNCPGKHDIFYACGYFGTDQQIAEGICKSPKPGFVRTNTTSDGHCGYGLIEVTCK